MQNTKPSEATSTTSTRGGDAQARTRWPARSSDSKPWTRWWWLGSAVDSAGLTEALEAYASAGLGGVEVCPIYGAIGAEQKFVPFLSPEWVSLLQHAVTEASRLGMKLDLTTGTGWPFGGPHVGPEHASCKLVLKRYPVASGAKLDEPLPRGTFEHAIALSEGGTSTSLSAHVADGAIRWDAPADGGPWQVVVAARQAPIQKVKRSAPGGEGNVVDPYDGSALDHYLAAFEPLVADAGAPRPHGHFHDSFEYYGADWTPSLLREFETRRAYDLRPHLGALAGIGSDELVARVRCDYRRTVAELHLDYVVRWTEWCHRHGGIAREQAHGAPTNLIDLYAATDVPETELFGVPNERELPMHKLASSASHLAGRRMTSCESFTWLGEHFQVTLDDAKAEADYLFLTGVNRVVFHGIAYSPSDVQWPGWLFYASVHFGPSGGLWRDLPAFNAYLARCQSVLQSGAPSRDVLLYFPTFDFWQAEPPPTAPTTATTAPAAPPLLAPFTMHDRRLPSHPFHATAMSMWRRGFLFDQVSDHFLNVARHWDGRIEINGMRYSAIVVPPCRVMPDSTLHNLLELARAGATVIFQGTLPDDVPGLHEADARRAALRSMLAELGPVGEERTIPLGAGRVIVGSSIEAMLAQADTPREPMADAGLFCERRSHGDGHAYFIVNRGDTSFDGWTALATPAVTAWLLDPRFEARVGRAAIRQREGQAEVYLQLAPGESIILQTTTDAHLPNNAWSYVRPEGHPRTIRGQWHVDFIDGGPVLPAAFATEQLGSWTDAADPEAKRFAGTARYRIEFDLAAEPAIDEWWLDLGRVSESARVRVNGHDVGTAWSAPFQLRVTESLRPGRNELEVEVTNLAANRIADLDRRSVPWKRFHEINFVNKDYKPFDASGWPLRDSGLLGPVRLLPMRRFLPS